jgi:RNA polymerase sigma-70 factor (ECF subfamily)
VEGRWEAVPKGRTPERRPGGEAWGALVARYWPLALRMARGILSRADLGEDVVQDAARALFERAATGSASFESEEHARNYFLRAVHHRALDHLREAERGRVQSLEASPEAQPAACDPLLALEEREARSRASERVRAALDSLRPAERELVRQRYLEGLAYREIAARTGAPISTLHSRVEAALARIRSRLGSERA